VIEQIIIAICGVSSVWLSQDTRPWLSKWACILGMLAQPFWMIAAWKAEQWGIFALSFVYAFGWGRGIRAYWIAPWLAKRAATEYGVP